MNARLVVAALAATVTIATSQTSRPQSGDATPLRVVYAADRAPPPGRSVPVGPAPAATPSRIGDHFWLCGDGRITTPLPVGYPDPTAPGALELKTYDVVRKAEIGGASAPELAANLGFFRLFNHIKSRDIAMTAPVEIEYGGMGADGALGDESWSMAFLYRDPGLGPVGKAGSVEVVDSTPTTYLSLGALGAYGMKDVLRALETLRGALEDLPAFETAGPIRVLHYNGPEAPSGRRWMEVQLPVRARSPAPASERGAE